MRIGLGEDIHRLVKGRKLMLAGIEIPSEVGEEAHSDGDVLLHAVADAIYGAIAEKDIGWHFPDNDPKTEGIDSRLIVKDALSLAKKKGCKVSSLDSNIFLENIKLKPYIDEMRKSLASILETEIENISIKARTNEGLGPVGLGQAVRATVITLLKEENDD